MLKLGLLSHIAGNLYLQIVVWSGSHHRDFPRDAHAPKPMGWDFSPSHWSVTCRAAKALDAFCCLNWGLDSTSEIFHSLFCFI